MIVYAENLKGNGTFTSQGSKAYGWIGTSGSGWQYHIYGGASGGGSVNLFYRNICEIEISSQTNVTSISSPAGGVGGKGSVNITKINQ